MGQTWPGMSLLFSCSVKSDSAISWTRHTGLPSFTISCSLHKLISVGLVMLSNHLILCHFLLLLPSNFPSIRFFSNKWALRIRLLNYWNSSFSISPQVTQHLTKYSGLISFRIDWFDPLAVQGTLKSLLQHHTKVNNSLASLRSNSHIHT